jgi:hypothetical protein
MRLSKKRDAKSNLQQCLNILSAQKMRAKRDYEPIRSGQISFTHRSKRYEIK